MREFNLLAALFMGFPLVALIIHLLWHKTKLLSSWLQSILCGLWLLLTILLFLKTPNITIIAVGQWHPPFGISLVFDPLVCMMLVLFAVVINCIHYYSQQDPDIISDKPQFYCGFWLLILGISGALVTGDVFNLYVWSEVMLLASLILLSCTQRNTTYIISRYAIMNIFGTLILLLAIALVYGITGSLNYADIARYFQSHQSLAALPVMGLLLFALGLKGGVFPLYFWLPNTYAKPSYSTTLLLSSLTTKVTMVVILRLSLLWLPLHNPWLHSLLIFIAGCTMFFGVLGAASQFYLRDILSFHVISQLGYIFLAIFLPGKLAVMAALLFLIHNTLVKTNLFMVSGFIEQHYGSGDVRRLGQILSKNKLLAVLFFVAAMSLAGLPPLSGFWAKFLVIKAALNQHFYGSAAMAILVSLFTLYSMIKIWRYAFCEEGYSSETQPVKIQFGMMLAVLPLFLIPLVIGFFPDSILQPLHRISEQLTTGNYIHAVLGGA